MIKDLARDRRFAFVVDCHEGWESPGFYLYELRRDGVGIAEEIARRVAETCPLNESAEIEGQLARGDENAKKPRPPCSTAPISCTRRAPATPFSRLWP